MPACSVKQISVCLAVCLFCWRGTLDYQQYEGLCFNPDRAGIEWALAVLQPHICVFCSEMSVLGATVCQSHTDTSTIAHACWLGTYCLNAKKAWLQTQAFWLSDWHKRLVNITVYFLPVQKCGKECSSQLTSYMYVRPEHLMQHSAEQTFKK